MKRFKNNALLAMMCVLLVACSFGCGHDEVEGKLMAPDEMVLNDNERDFLRAGNKLFNDSNFSDAEVEYRKALEANPKSEIARYNLANALLQQAIRQKNDTLLNEAVQTFQQLVDECENKALLNASFHNLGDIFYANEQYDKAVELFENALRVNPADDNARYNLRMAQLKLKQQEQQKKQEQEQEQQEQKQEQKQKSDSGDLREVKLKQMEKQHRDDIKQNPQNNESRDSLRIDKARLQQGEQKLKPMKPEQKQKDENEKDKENDKKENKSPDKPGDKKEGYTPVQPAGQANAELILNAVQQSEKQTKDKIGEKLEQQQRGERDRTRNRW